MKFKELALFLEKLENTASRNEMTEMVAEFLGKLDSKEVKPFMYFIQGRLVPKYVDLEFNISRKLLLKALSEFYTVEPKEVKEVFNKQGDVGKTAEIIIDNYKLKEKFRDKNISKSFIPENFDNKINQIYELLKKLAKYEGKGSQESKMSMYAYLINALDSSESIRYVSRIIVGELRLGLSDKTLLDSLSWHKLGDKSLRKTLDTAFGSKSDIGEIAELVLTSKNIQDDLSKIKLEPGVPVASKLVERESSSAKVWERMPNCFVQPKLDGLRGQLHYSTHLLENTETKTALFSRNMENMSEQFPEITEALENLEIESIILDSEIIGFDEETGEYLTYQETMQRKRKYDIEKFSKDIPVKAMCFDVLYLNGKDLTQEPIEKRIELLKNIINSCKGKALDMLETLQMNSEEELDDYFQDKVLNGLEGIITKEKESNYEPGTRNYKWIKLKANSKSELVDTVDVVVMGYFSGRGQRAKFGVGALLTGVYDPEEDKYYTIGKVGSGIKDDEFEKIKNDLDNNMSETMPENYVVENNLIPDYWVNPNIIVEIDADEITRSPSHTAARGKKSNVKKDNSEKGLSIRFPRLKIWDRDKEYPNTINEIIRLYELRKGA